MPKTISRSELSNLRMVAGNEKKYSRIILNGHVHNWVGFGWVDEGPATDEDSRNYPTVEEK